MSHDHITHEHVWCELGSIEGQGVAVRHSHRRRIADDVEAGEIGITYLVIYGTCTSVCIKNTSAFDEAMDPDRSSPTALVAKCETRR